MSSSNLTAQRLREVLQYAPEIGVFTWRVRGTNSVQVGAVAGCINYYGYCQISIDAVRYLAHRLAWLYVYGVWPESDLDHINRIRSDNRIANLRQASRSENQQNTGRRSDNTSGFKGVYWNKREQMWCAQIKHESRSIHLGYFDDINEAVSTREEAEMRPFPFASR